MVPPKQCLFVMVITIDVVCVRKEKEGVTSPGMGGEVEEGGEMEKEMKEENGRDNEEEIVWSYMPQKEQKKEKVKRRKRSRRMVMMKRRRRWIVGRY